MNHKLLQTQSDQEGLYTSHCFGIVAEREMVRGYCLQPQVDLLVVR